ncbi:MAG TPA: 5'-methylthioadenosine/adenosylhomocysteine nucleosidase [Bacteroidia bacterium]|nr:5'-methylthioadenosine/adenosylhomocysteine nucleosidase [Bacteroidia bacterium]
MKKTIGIMGAMPEEIDGVVSLLSNCKKSSAGMRTYYTGTIEGIETVVVFSRWGKVAAATTVSTLIHQFNITELLFTGVAGAISPDLRIGDIVIANRLIQHDMDARPLMSRYEIPLLNQTWFAGDSALITKATASINRLLETKTLHTVIGDSALDEFDIISPQLYSGDVASGDLFFSEARQKHILHRQLPSVLCVEMEGAAVAQVCYEHGIPFVIIRTISDIADDKSHIDFPRFIEKISSRYSTEIIKHVYS